MENNSNDRARIAESAMQGILSNVSLVNNLSNAYKHGNSMENLVAYLSVKCADALIKVLNEK